MKKELLPPFFSIITPVYNGQKFLNRFFTALRHQSFTDWELIIVNDKSDDDSHILLSRYASEDSRVKYFKSYPDTYLRHGTKGPYAPRNFAIDQANGKYLCFLDIDDYWLPDKLLNDFLEIEQNKELSLLYSNCFLSYGPHPHKYFRRYELSFLPPKSQIYFSNPIPNLTSCLSRDALGDTRFEPIPHEDYVFWFCILNRILPASLFKHSTPQSVHYVSSTSLSGNKLIVLRWWILCYRRFGYSWHRSILYLSVRVVMYFLESSLYAFGFGKIDPRSIPSFSVSDVSIQ